MGSGIEAFTRLHHAVFLTRGDGTVEGAGGGGDGSAATSADGGAGAAEGKGGAEGGAEGEVEGEAELYVLQLVPSELAWRARGCVVRLEADSPGDLPAGALLSVRLRLRAADGARRGTACRTRVFLRVPGWAVAAEAEVVRAGSAPVALPPPPPRSLLEVRLGAGNVLALRLRTAPALWPARSDGGGGNGGGGSVPSGGGDVLFALLYGPVLLAALSTGERRFFAPPSAAAPPSGGAAAATGWPAWLHPVPEAARRQLHTLQLDPGGVGGAAGSAARRRVLSHRGEGAPPQLEVEPAQPPTRAGRRGGSDGVDAATWRVVPQPPPGEATAGEATAGAAWTRPVVFEAFDRPGYVLTAGDGAASPLLVGGTEHPSAPRLRLMPARPPSDDGAQRWWMRLVGGTEPRYALESAAAAGLWLVAADTDTAPPLLRRLPNAGGGGVPAGAAVFALRAPLATYPPLAFWARSNATQQLSCPATAAGCTSRGTFLMVPLNELLDESYSAHLCVLSPGTRAPKWCT